MKSALSRGNLVPYSAGMGKRSVVKQYRWIITSVGESPARELRLVSAPDRDSALLRAEELFRVPKERLFAYCYGEVKSQHSGNVGEAPEQVD